MIVAQAAFVCSYTLTVRVTGIDRSHNHIGQTNPEDKKKKMLSSKRSEFDTFIITKSSGRSLSLSWSMQHM